MQSRRQVFAWGNAVDKFDQVWHVSDQQHDGVLDIKSQIKGVI